MPATGVGVADDRVRQGRRIVLAAAIVVCVGKLVLAATTFGTNDVGHWLDFLSGVRRAGPVGIYGIHFQHSFYNHPPLMGYYLDLVGAFTHLGLSAQFTIRAVSSVADVASAIIVFEMVRRRRGIAEAVFAGVVVGASPVLIVISGFHGNTDPVFVMLTLLSVYLLADRASPAAAGTAMALAVGIKVVPVVAVPSLLVFAALSDRRTFVRYLGAMAGVSAVFWLPALSTHGSAVIHDVLGYAGVNHHNWGLPRLMRSAGLSTGWIDGPGRFLVVAVCAVLPAVLVARCRGAVPQAVSLALAGFLALTPTYGNQYLVWGAATTVLLTTFGGTLYNILAGLLLLEVYNRWNGGLPWYRASASEFTSSESLFAIVVWASLCCAVAYGAWRALRDGSRTWTGSVPAESTAASQGRPAPAAEPRGSDHSQPSHVPGLQAKRKEFM